MTPDGNTPGAGSPPPIRRGRAARRLAVCATLVAAVGFAAYWRSSVHEPAAAPPQPRQQEEAEGPLPTDPRLAYHGPFRNVRPGVRYVGDASCAECHEKIAGTYAQHPMGRSLVPAAPFRARLPLDAAHHNPFEAFGIQFRVDSQGDRLLHRQTRLDPGGKPVYDFAHEVNYVVGSGARGHSYLTVRDGYVFQTPISWFSQKQRWDLSPGFPEWARAGRLIQGACLYCHANHVEPVAGARNRYKEPVFRGHAIGCERCHGPGELHAASTGKDDIVNPGRLGWELREAVCQQCHLEGLTRVVRRGREENDFRPGMPLQDFWTVFVPGPRLGRTNMAIGHVEQMYESVCFQRSPTERKMGCTTCHNPHEAVAPDRRVGYYRARCLQCHTRPAAECALPEPARRARQRDDSCVACHMPRVATSDVAHTASSDHRIIRKAGEEPTARGRGQAAGFPVLDFFRGPPDLKDPGLARDLGVALYQLTLKGIPLAEPDGDFALRHLDAALKECPADVDALEARGKIRQAINRPEQAAEALEALLKRVPRHETALVSLGTIHRDQRHSDEAVEYWRRAVEVNPHVAAYRMNLATQLADRADWQELRPHCQRWVELDPASAQARSMWVQCLLKTGDKAAARVEYEKLRALRPPGLADFDAWFLPQLR
jgi:predicted CXXCH cytochrome family protein